MKWEEIQRSTRGTRQKTCAFLFISFCFFFLGCSLKGSRGGGKLEPFESALQERELGENEKEILKDLCALKDENEQPFYDENFDRVFIFSLEGAMCGIQQPFVLIKTRPILKNGQFSFSPIPEKSAFLDPLSIQFLETEMTLENFPLNYLCQKPEEGRKNTHLISEQQIIQFAIKREKNSILLKISNFKKGAGEKFHKNKDETYRFRDLGFEQSGLLLEKKVRIKCKDKTLGIMTRRFVEVL